ncbi:hypothetical protein [Paenibacillus silvisoli]|uniref:hypothetical protein n=1 Tax=Paenibacillus silvisoli TaxID=3110539 RepID=UPI00280556C6|nr:hypothetical protein [Paenibacillus silvisoli]
MVHPWMTNTVILFGVIVAVVGVVAYFRVYKSSAWSATTTSRSQPADRMNDDSAGAGASPEDDKNFKDL